MIRITINPKADPKSYNFSQNFIRIGDEKTYSSIDLPLKTPHLLIISQNSEGFKIINANPLEICLLNDRPFQEEVLHFGDLIRAGSFEILCEPTGGTLENAPSLIEMKPFTAIPPHKTFSDEEIDVLIKQAEKKEKYTVALGELNDKDENSEITSSTWKSKLLIPISLVAFILSALYLYEERKISPEFPMQTKSLDSPIHIRHHTLMKSAPIHFHTLSKSIKNLAKERKEHLANAAEQLELILKGNAEGSIKDFKFHYENAINAYRDAELDEAKLIATMLESMYEETDPKGDDQIELFKLLVHESKLQDYLTFNLLQKLSVQKSITKDLLRLDMKTFHTKVAKIK